MTKRSTRCWTYGTYETKGFPILDPHESGRTIGRVCIAVYQTLCGREDLDDTSEMAPDVMPHELTKRPLGVCRACWARWAEDVGRSRAV